MAKFFVNPFVQRIAGRFGDIVVRKLRGKMYISRMPEGDRPPPSEAQRSVLTRFKLAATYAREVMADPVRRSFYDQVAAAQQRANFTVALTDFLKPPNIESIETGEYSGKVGSKIKVVATDDVAVAAVGVLIRSAAGATIEQGAATQANGVWVYTATTNLTVGQAVTIVAKATDRPGNTTVEEKGFTG